MRSPQEGVGPDSRRERAQFLEKAGMRGKPFSRPIHETALESGQDRYLPTTLTRRDQITAVNPKRMGRINTFSGNEPLHAELRTKRESSPVNHYFSISILRLTSPEARQTFAKLGQPRVQSRGRIF
jgi:hypothetical protein